MRRLSLRLLTLIVLLGAVPPGVGALQLGARQTGRPNTGTLILVRHGQTVWDRNAFIGWADPDLGFEGEQQAFAVARALRESGYTFDVAYTSLLKRAVRSTWLILKELELSYLPVWKTWALNERSYGSLTGQSVTDATAAYGEATVASWRRSFSSAPPPYEPDHPFNPSGNRMYERWQDRRGQIRPVTIPGTESLGDVAARCIPVLKNDILPDLREGKSVLVVAHGNSIRAIIQALDNVPDAAISEVEIPPCIPLVYRFERKGSELITMSPSSSRGGYIRGAEDSLLSGEFLGAPSDVQAAQALQRGRSLLRYGIVAASSPAAETTEALRRQIAGSPASVAAPAVEALPPPPPPTPSAGGLIEIAARADERFAAAPPEGFYWADDPPTEVAGGVTADVTGVNAGVTAGGASAEAASEEEGNEASLRWTEEQLPEPAPRAKAPQSQRQYVVIIRHGKTEHNKLGLFTGWEDVSLAPEGRAEATEAGRLLREAGIEFDVVYTSWLSRAIQTAWLVMSEMDCLWLPIHKSWRLNERMYGALTGLSKKKTRAQYGDVQFKKWRRSYNTKPPPVSSFSQHYPGNDERYVQNIIDLRFSAKESLIRSLESGRLRLHRKLPRTESLKDCMDRTIPYWINTIQKEGIGSGRSVLIASSENAIRGLLMHLFQIPKERISEIEIPTGLPMLYDLDARCLRLLGDKDFSDYDFGKSGELLFTPCQVPPSDFEEENNEQ